MLAVGLGRVHEVPIPVIQAVELTSLVELSLFIPARRADRKPRFLCRIHGNAAVDLRSPGDRDAATAEDVELDELGSHALGGARGAGLPQHVLVVVFQCVKQGKSLVTPVFTALRGIPVPLENQWKWLCYRTEERCSGKECV